MFISGGVKSIELLLAIGSGSSHPWHESSADLLLLWLLLAAELLFIWGAWAPSVFLAALT
jgi:hypothetical protein